LPRSVGWQKASELIFTGRIISADEALEMGMLLSVHDSNELLGEASSLANLIASKPRLALTYAKELLRLNSFELKANMSKAALMQAVLHASDEHRQLLSKFFEERKPK
jgi:enoyl-CoA hydratase/carnithine racemase